MKGHEMTMDRLLPGQRAEIQRLATQGAMRRRLLDIGLIPGTKIQCVGRSPMGDPSAFLIRGAVIAIRRKDCSSIMVERI